MEERDDIYKSRKEVERLLRRIDEAKFMDKESKGILHKFYENCVAQCLSLARIKCFLFDTFCIYKMLGVPFSKATKDDIMKTVIEIEKRDWAELTKLQFKAVLRQFYKWLRQTEDFPPEVKWIKLNAHKNHNHRLPEEILTEAEVIKIAETADSTRDKALVLTLYESGCRIGETLNLKIRNIQFDQYGCVLLVSGKTGQRRIRIISSASVLMNWLNTHPFRDNPDAYIWIGMGTRNKYGRLSYGAVLSILKNLGKKANIKKDIHPHCLRHARATHLADKLTEAQMKEMFGWVQASDMASVYVHLSGRNVDNALLSLHGMTKDEDRKEDVLKVKTCPRCQEKNSPIQQFCGKCGSPLSLRIAMDTEEKRKRKDELLSKVLDGDDELLKLLLEKIKSKGLAEEFFKLD